MNIETIVGFSLLFGLTGIVTASVYAKRYSMLLTKFKRDNTEKNKLQTELLGMRKQLNANKFKIISHTVLMDGISGAGKSSFIARLVSPVTTTQDLQNMIATDSEYQSVDIPICWETGAKTTLHSLNFFDVAGENSGSFVDALLELKNKNTNVVLVIVWDLLTEDNWTKSINHFNKQRILATYGSKLASTTIKSIIIFFNKIDLVDVKIAEQRIKYARNAINKHFESTFESRYGDIYFISGSILEGTRVHDCLGIILQKLGLASNFYNITGNTSIPKNI